MEAQSVVVPADPLLKSKGRKKKGKVFASKQAMLNLVNSVNDTEENVIKEKTEKMLLWNQKSINYKAEREEKKKKKEERLKQKKEKINSRKGKSSVTKTKGKSTKKTSSKKVSFK